MTVPLPRAAARPSAAEGVAGRRAGRLSAGDWVESCLALIAEREPVVRAWAHLDGAGARAEAARDRAGLSGPLAGMPFGVKDVIDVAGLPTGCNSPVEEGKIAAATAEAVRRLEAAGAVCLGKTVTAEYAFTEPGPTRNPLDLARTPGGSSSGSAAAVADFHIPVALATQTGGSTIRPAAFCGIVGYKPPFGFVPNDGLRLLAPSLDVIGLHARSVADAALVASVMERRARPVDAPAPPAFVAMPLPRQDECVPAVATALLDAVERLRRAGASVREAALPEGFDGLDAAHRVVMSVEVARSFAGLPRSDRERLSESLRGFIERGEREGGRDLSRAHALVARCRAALVPFARAGEVILTPSAPGEAPLGLASTGASHFNRLWSLLGVAVLTVPNGSGPAGLPLGLQLADPDPAGSLLFPAAAFAEAALRPAESRPVGNAA